MRSAKSKSQTLLKPASLRAGDTVGIVAPASPAQKDALEAGRAHFEKLGYKVVFSPSIYDSELFFAGSIARRCRELEEMFENDAVRAIICARGGYGTNTLLEHLDLAKIIRHPKIFVGYSDTTTLLTYFHDCTGLVCFHGAMAAKDFAEPDHVDEQSWKNSLEGKENWRVPAGRAIPISAGRAEGKLYGGCLSMLVASLGTPYEIRSENTLLFLEDVAVKPFQVHRMLMHLKLAGKLKRVKGIIFGEMLDCGDNSLLVKGIQNALGHLEVPIAFGINSGHVAGKNITIPIGVRASLAVSEKVELKILESAVAAAVTRPTPARARA